MKNSFKILLFLLSLFIILSCNNQGSSPADTVLGETGSEIGSVDIDSDGMPDGVAIDVDGDGQPDGVDTNNDGKIDVEWSDACKIIAKESLIGQIGTDIGIVDTDGDGSPNGVAIDIDGDDLPDGVDTDSDGAIDLEWTSEYTILNKPIITSFSFLLEKNVDLMLDCFGTISESTIEVIVPFGSDTSSLIATFDTTGQSVLVSSIVQESGLSANDFTDIVIYRVVDGNGIYRDYTLSVVISTLPTVETPDSFHIRGNYINGAVKIINPGSSAVLEAGVCVNTAGSPTISDSFSTGSTSFRPDYYLYEHRGLDEQTVYYVRAYAKNSQGVSYGNEVSFNSGYIIDGQTVKFGGYVTYNDGKGGGLVCAVDDLSDGLGNFTFQWGPSSVTQDPISGAPYISDYGGGKTNSEYMYETYNMKDSTVNQTSFGGFWYCLNLDSNGYSDWYIPSFDELKKIDMYLSFSGLITFEGTHHWSSTRHDGSSGKHVILTDTGTGHATYFYKYRIRPVRYF